MLVWKAMPSITPMMSTIFLDEALIEPIVSTTCDTTAPPFTATSEAETASWFACRALSAFCFTVEVSSSIDAAVCSSELACSSVRDDRSWLPEAICPEAVAMVSVPVRTSPTTFARLAFMSFSACISCPVSSRLSTRMFALRSPAATVSATSSAWPSGRTMPSVRRQANSAPTASAMADSTSSVVRPSVWSAAMPLAAASIFSRWWLARFSTAPA
ncbi:hypothetical protein D3C85_212650 [compost metagenome]